MPSDKQNVQFLYSILKQIELKGINWALIAEANTIPNGHAARMRFHRLRQAMEGTVPRPRMPKDPDAKLGKSFNKRKAGSDAASKLKQKLAALEESDEDEEALSGPAAKRIKVNMENDRRDEFGSVEWIKREEHNSMDIKIENAGVEPQAIQETPVNSDVVGFVQGHPVEYRDETVPEVAQQLELSTMLTYDIKAEI